MIGLTADTQVVSPFSASTLLDILPMSFSSAFRRLICAVCFGALFPALALAHGQRQEDFYRLGRATGYVLAQDYVVGQIAEKYPELSTSVAQFNDAFNKRFPAVREKLEQHVMGFGLTREQFQGIKDNMLAGSRSELNALVKNREDAKRLLLGYTMRIYMPDAEEREVVLTLNDVVFDEQPEREFDVDSVAYSSQSLPNSKGVDIRLRVPASWEHKPGNGSLILDSWHKIDGHARISLILMRVPVKMKSGQWGDQDLKRLIADPAILSELVGGQELVEASADLTEYGGRKAIRYTMKEVQTIQGVRLYLSSVKMITGEGDNVVVADFHVVATEQPLAEKMQARYAELKKRIFDSVQIFPLGADPVDESRAEAAPAKP